MFDVTRTARQLVLWQYSYPTVTCSWSTLLLMTVSKFLHHLLKVFLFAPVSILQGLLGLLENLELLEFSWIFFAHLENLQWDPSGIPFQELF